MTAHPITDAGKPHHVDVDLVALLSRRGADQRVGGGFGPPPVGLPADAVPLNGGTPASEALPVDDLRAAFERVLSRRGVSALQYSGAVGAPELRAQIARLEGVDPARVLVTNGGLHALSLTFSALLDDGDLVALENPTYPLVLRVLQPLGARYLPVPVDADGIDPDALEEQLIAGARPKLLYLIPDFQNPTGTTLPTARRKRLIDLAEHYRFVIVSDNAYEPLRFRGEPVPAFDASSPSVVRAATFAKTLGPGLRLGWLVVPEWLAPAITRIRQNQDQHSPLLSQLAVADLLDAPGVYDAAVDRAKAIYAERSDALLGELAELLPDQLEVTRPEGGIFAWVRVLDSEIDLVNARQVAHTLGTDFSVGSYFDSSGAGGFADRIRLGFSHQPADRLKIAADRVARALGDPRSRTEHGGR